MKPSHPFAIISIALSVTSFSPLAKAKTIVIDTKIPGVTAKLEESKQSFTLTLTGGPVTKNANFQWDAGGEFWRLNFSLSLIDNKTTLYPDSVSLIGGVYHLANPHPGEIKGKTLSYKFEVKGNQLHLGGVDSYVTFDNVVGENGSNQKNKDHQTHQDGYDGMAVGSGSLDMDTYKSNIEGWSMTLEGSHPGPVPEPGTLAMGAAGLALLFACSASRRGASARRPSRLPCPS